MHNSGDPNDILAGIDDVPWHRLVHFYGRASDIPPTIRALGGPKRNDAIESLRRRLEHQDSVTQATPFAVRFILRMAEIDPEGVQQIIQPIAAAAEFTLKNFSGTRPQVDWHSLLRENCLWPEFTTELDDEIRWEEWNPPSDEWIAWPILTLREIAKA